MAETPAPILEERLHHARTVRKLLLGNLHLTQQLLFQQEMMERELKRVLKIGQAPKSLGESNELSTKYNCFVVAPKDARSLTEKIRGEGYLPKGELKDLLTNPCAEQPLPPQGKVVGPTRKRLKFEAKKKRGFFNPKTGTIVQLSGIPRAIMEILYNTKKRMIRMDALATKMYTHMDDLDIQYKSIQDAVARLVKRRLLVHDKEKKTLHLNPWLGI